MPATTVHLKRGVHSVAPCPSNTTDLDKSTFNEDISQDTQLPFPQHTQNQESVISPQHKRARVNHLCPSPDSFDLNSTSPLQIQARVNTTTLSSIPPPNESLRLHQDQLVQIEMYDGRLLDDLIQSPWCNLPAGAMGGGRLRPDDAVQHVNDGARSRGKRRPEMLDTEATPFSRSNKLMPRKSVRGVSSRRQMVPGENLPRLASSWRETTSSKGLENPLSGHYQARSKSLIPFGTGASTARSGTGFPGVEIDPDALSLNISTASGEANIDTPRQDYWQHNWDPSWLDSVVDEINQYPAGFPAPFNEDASHSGDGTVPSSNSFSSWPTTMPLDTGASSTFIDASCPDLALFNTEIELPPGQADVLSDYFTLDPFILQPDITSFSSVPRRPEDRAFPLLLSVPTQVGQDTTINSGDAFSDSMSNYLLRPTDTGTEELNEEDLLMQGHRDINGFDLLEQTSYTDPMFSISSSTFQGPLSFLEMGYSQQSAHYQGGYTENIRSNHLQLQDWNSSSYNTFSNSLLVEASSNSLLMPPSHIDRHHSLSTPENFAKDIIPYVTDAPPSMLLGSSQFSADSNSLPFHQGDSYHSPGFASDDRVGSSFEIIRGKSGSGVSKENQPSWFNGGSQVSEDLSNWTQMPQIVSSATSNPRFTQLKDGRVVVTENTNETQLEVQNLLARANRRSASKGSSASPSSRKVEWKHTFSFAKGLHDTTEPQENSSRRTGGRVGPLSDETKERAGEIRKIGSCLRCRVAKIGCTLGSICDPCRKAGVSPLSHKIWCRGHLQDFTNLFLPEEAIRAFQKTSLDRLIKEHVSGFSQNSVEICAMSGPNYPVLRLTVHEFLPRDPSMLIFKKLVIDRASNTSILREVYSPPLGIKDLNQESRKDIAAKLKNHILDIASCERNYGEVVYGNTSKLTWDEYEAMRKYQQANLNDELLQKVLMLYAMQDFMATSIIISQDSCKEALESLQRPTQWPYEHSNILRLINSQIKNVMHDIIYQTYFAVLNGLEKRLLPKEKASWASTFCCIMGLSMCAEMVQTTTDFRIVNALVDQEKSASGLNKNGTILSRDASIDACRKLDDVPIKEATGLFHLVNKTNRPKDGAKRNRGFNPIRDGLDAVQEAELGKGVSDFVVALRDIVAKHGVDLEERAAPPTFTSDISPLNNHVLFRKRNSGRLVAVFLRSFL